MNIEWLIDLNMNMKIYVDVLNKWHLNYVFSIEDELRIYTRLLDELMKKSSNSTLTTIRSTDTNDQNISSLSSIFQHTRNESTTNASTGIFDLAGSHSGWPHTTNLTTSDSTENLFKTNEDEIHETFDGNSIIKSSSFSTLN